MGCTKKLFQTYPPQKALEAKNKLSFTCVNKQPSQFMCNGSRCLDVSASHCGCIVHDECVFSQTLSVWRRGSGLRPTKSHSQNTGAQIKVSPKTSCTFFVVPETCRSLVVWLVQSCCLFGQGGSLFHIGLVCFSIYLQQC